jgi:two-component system chemotaxis response regulator CheB
MGPIFEDKRKSVLVVDDSGIVRTLVKQIIAVDTEFKVVGEAGDGYAGIMAAMRLRPEIIVLDLEMPKMDGFEMLGRLKVFSTAKVIVLSAIDDVTSEAAQSAKRLGAFDVIPKPSGTISLDLKPKRGRQLLEVLHLAAGLPPPDFQAMAIRMRERGSADL